MQTTGDKIIEKAVEELFGDKDYAGPHLFTFRSLKLSGSDKNRTWRLSLKINATLEHMPHFVPVLFVPDITPFLENIEDSRRREAEQPSLMGSYDHERERIENAMVAFIKEHQPFNEDTTVVVGIEFAQDGKTILTLEVPDTLVQDISKNRFQLEQWRVMFTEKSGQKILEAWAAQ